MDRESLLPLSDSRRPLCVTLATDVIIFSYDFLRVRVAIRDDQISGYWLFKYFFKLTFKASSKFSQVDVLQKTR